MKLLVFGQTGQVARALARIAPLATFLGRDQVDLSDPAACAAAIAASRADAVINAAAWTDVDAAEGEEAAATLVNAHAPAAMARAAAVKGLPFLHLSTDHVFDGAGDRPFTPDDPTLPLNAYGRSKLAGEQAIRAVGGRYLILRTSWVFSGQPGNFVSTIQRLGRQRENLDVVCDQIGGPTPASALAQALVSAATALCDGAAGGTHHFAGAPDISRSALARQVIAYAGLPCRIRDIPTAAYPTPARRPLNSRLDGRSFHAAFGIARPDWQAGLATLLKESVT